MSLTGVINDDLLTLVHAHFIIIVTTEGLLFLGVWEVGGAAVPGGMGGGRGRSWECGRWEGLLFLGVWEVGGAAVPGGVGGGRGCCSWGCGRWEGLLFLGGMGGGSGG